MGLELRRDYFVKPPFANYSIGQLVIKAGRIPLIYQRIDEGRVYVAGDPVAEHRTTFAWGLALRTRVVKGLENWDAAMKARSEKLPLVLAVPHVSDADTLYIEQALRGEGRNEDANEIVYITGLNMDERWYISMNIQGGNRIYVETPLVMKDLKNYLDSDLQSVPRHLFRAYQKAGEALNLAAAEEIFHAKRRKQVIVVYPQATRSSSGLIQRGHPDTEGLLKRGIILPCMIRGSERFMPARKIPPFWKWIWPGGIVDVEFGEPFLAKETRAQAKDGLAEMDANFVDLVMAEIGKKDWERVDPEIRPLHQKICEEVPVVPLAA